MQHANFNGKVETQVANPALMGPEIGINTEAILNMWYNHHGQAAICFPLEINISLKMGIFLTGCSRNAYT